MLKTMATFVFSVNPVCTSEARLSDILVYANQDDTYPKLYKKGSKKRH